MKRSRILALTVAIAAVTTAGPVLANCPPLSVYRVGGVSLANGTLAQAADMLLAGTAWKAETSPQASTMRVSMKNVGGPTDKVLAAVLDSASNDTYAVASTQDTSACVVHVTATRIAPPPAPPVALAASHAPVAGNSSMPRIPAETFPSGKGVAPAAAPAPAYPKVDPVPASYTLPAHMLLSKALARYVTHEGWTLKWNIPDDYMLDAPFPIPGSDDVISGVTYVVNAYKVQGGMLGEAPCFAKPNHVVVMVPSTAACLTGSTAADPQQEWH
ncbi:MAG: hypothetical protein EPN36_14120 [Rhodanobacteraceae bacterium]|nr:MAG: hypothetical protein EPN36_14120 [Rhodanobacteraceae bacterium]